MKRVSLILVLLLMTSAFTTRICHPQAKPQPDPGIRVDTEKYQPAGVLVGEQVIRSGDRLPIIWGFLGPPDKIWSMRGKKTKDDDYVKLDYFSYGFSVDVANNTNQVKGILVEENNVSTRMVNCPFRIGQDISQVTASWGDPEKQVGNTLAYWRRGVYIGLTDDNKVKYLFFTYPGEFDE